MSIRRDFRNSNEALSGSHPRPSCPLPPVPLVARRRSRQPDVASRGDTRRMTSGDADEDVDISRVSSKSDDDAVPAGLSDVVLHLVVHVAQVAELTAGAG